MRSAHPPARDVLAGPGGEGRTTAATSPVVLAASKSPVRLLALDVARGLAVLMMFAAHVAPSDGPLRILLTTEFLTAPLFALLVGCGAQLARHRHHRTGAGRQVAGAGRQVVRALGLIALGVLLMLSSAQVVIVLVHLGVLALLCIPLARCRTSVLTGWAVLAGLAALVLPMVTAAYGAGLRGPGADGGELLLRAVAALGGAGPYRLAAFVLYACAGMLLMRALAGREPGGAARGWKVTGMAGLGALALMAALLIAPNLLGLFGVHAYDGTPAETLGNLAGAAGIVMLCWAVFEGPIGDVLPEMLQRLLAAPGQMALTLYSLQALILHTYVVLSGGARDDHWWMLALLIGSSLGLAWLWQGLGAVLSTARHLPPAMRRGPIEGFIDLAARGLVR